MTPGATSSARRSKSIGTKSGRGRQPARTASRRKSKPAEQMEFGRRHWLRAVALLLGILVLLAHVFTLKPIAAWLGWMHIDWPDIAKHCAMLSLFTLTYRLSWAEISIAGPGLSASGRASLASLSICSAWGAICETLQLWIPARDFNVWELAINIFTPLLIVGFVQLCVLAMPALRRIRA